MTRLRGEKPKTFVLPLAAFIFLSGLFYFCLSLYKINKASIFDGKNQINIIIDLKQILLCIYKPESQSLSILILPENLYVKVPFSLGYYKISTVWNLNRLVSSKYKQTSGGKLLKRTIEDNLFFSTDGWIKDKESLNLNSHPKIDKKTIKNFLKQNSGFFGLLAIVARINQRNKQETNLSIFDFFRSFLSLAKVRDDKIAIENLDKWPVLETKKLSDGTVVQTINEEKLRANLADFFSNETIKNEGLQISVINANETGGVGKKAANIISFFSGSVIQVKSAEKTIPKTSCEVRNREVLKTQTFKKIKSIFNCQVKDLNDNERSDINLIIGLDYY